MEMDLRIEEQRKFWKAFEKVNLISFLSSLPLSYFLSLPNFHLWNNENDEKNNIFIISRLIMLLFSSLSLFPIIFILSFFCIILFQSLFSLGPTLYIEIMFICIFILQHQSRAREKERYYSGLGWKVIMSQWMQDRWETSENEWYLSHLHFCSLYMYIIMHPSAHLSSSFWSFIPLSNSATPSHLSS